jgi:hypothetical protein
MSGARFQGAPRRFIHRRHAHVDRAPVAPANLGEHVGVADDHRPFGDQTDWRAAGEQGLQRPPGELVMSFDRLIGIGRRADGDLLADPRRSVQLAAKHVDQVDLHEDDGREVVVRAELELRLVPPREAVVAGVRAPAIRVQRPAERHALDRIERRSACHFLVAGLIGAALRFVERGVAVLANLEGDGPSGGRPFSQIEDEGLFGHGAVSSFVRPKSTAFTVKRASLSFQQRGHAGHGALKFAAPANRRAVEPRSLGRRGRIRTAFNRSKEEREAMG